MRPTRANLLRHRGHGPVHLDLVFGGGPRCPTLHLQRQHHRWSAGWGQPHRRRYLTYRGPLGGGRGSVASIWQGVAQWWRLSGGWCVRLGGKITIVMRRTHEWKSRKVGPKSQKSEVGSRKYRHADNQADSTFGNFRLPTSDFRLFFRGFRG